MIKKTFAFLTGCVILGVGCSKTNTNEEETAMPQSEGRMCGSYENLQRQLAEDPSLSSRMAEIETFTEKVLANPQAYQSRLVNGRIVIPVYVNVLYNTAAQNISAAQIQSQIDVLNKDYSATNTDYGNTPSIFQSVRSGDIGVTFELAGVVTKQTNKTSWRANDDMKKSTKGGINPTNPTTALNLWCCNLSNSLLGYAQFPGGAAATDGVVIDTEAFGITSGPYGLGRTATHEVGHWLNLRHIWGDATCGNDFVADTPLHNTSNGGCPTYPHYSTCTGTPVEMTMNYMDYTYDACMYMFTLGQKARMQAVWAVGGPRAALAQP